MHPLRLPSLLLMLALAGCDPSPSTPTGAESVPTPAPAAPPLTDTGLAAALPDAEYPIDAVDGGRAPLADGVYLSPGPGASGDTAVRLGPARASGDLDGDGVADAAVTLGVSPGGSGEFTYVAAVLDRAGRAAPLPAVLVGDRIGVDAVRIIDGQVVLDVRERAAGAAMSSPADVPARREFVVRDGALVPAAGAEPARLRGRYTWGAEVETLQPCGSEQTYWLAGDTAQLQPLRDRARAIAQSSGKPYTPIYVEVAAARDEAQPDGFAADYDGVYRLQSVLGVADTLPVECL